MADITDPFDTPEFNAAMNGFLDNLQMKPFRTIAYQTEAITYEEEQKLEAMEDQGPLTHNAALLRMVRASESKGSFKRFCEIVKKLGYKSKYDQMMGKGQSQPTQAPQQVPSRPAEQGQSQPTQAPQQVPSRPAEQDVGMYSGSGPASTNTGRPAVVPDGSSAQASPQAASSNSNIIGSTVADDDKYEMLSSSPDKRGIALIINNTFTGENARHGSKKDLQALVQLWAYLRFTVLTLTDATAQEMRNEIKKVAKESHESYDCVVVCIMSHGSENTVRGEDGKDVPIDGLIELFYDVPSLRGKPKMFFIQACRGIKIAQHTLAADTSQPVIPVGLDPSPSTVDVLVCFSTAKDYASLRNELDGSWYIEHLVEVFKKHHKNEHVLDLMTRVNRELQVKCLGQYHQVASFRSQLTKKVFLK